LLTLLLFLFLFLFLIQILILILIIINSLPVISSLLLSQLLLALVPPAELLLDKRDRYGWSPLMCAVHHDAYDCAQLLLARGASMSLRNGVGKNVLHIAAARGRNLILELLLAAAEKLSASDAPAEPLSAEGADAETAEAATSAPPSRSGKKGGKEAKKTLLAALLLQRDDGGMTPVHEASYRGHPNTYSLLARSAPDALMVKDGLRNTPSDYLDV
jgi:ankyrin repeat protein